MSRVTARDVLREWSADIGSVPSAEHRFVCRLCLGPVTDYRQCSACHLIFHVGAAPIALQACVVPMTSALNPSRWYTALAAYKRRFHRPYERVLASVAHHFLSGLRTKIETALGGGIDVLTVVPSKRAGVTYETQPLRHALCLIEPIRALLRETLCYDAGVAWSRRTYTPRAFTAGPAGVEGKRVLLVEDSWVSGATAISAAGALLHLGAASVLIAPIARVIDGDYWPEDHPYRVAMREPWNPDAPTWPR